MKKFLIILSLVILLGLPLAAQAAYVPITDADMLPPAPQWQSWAAYAPGTLVGTANPPGVALEVTISTIRLRLAGAATQIPGVRKVTTSSSLLVAVR